MTADTSVVTAETTGDWWLLYRDHWRQVHGYCSDHWRLVVTTATTSRDHGSYWRLYSDQWKQQRQQRQQRSVETGEDPAISNHWRLQRPVETGGYCRDQWRLVKTAETNGDG